MPTSAQASRAGRGATLQCSRELSVLKRRRAGRGGAAARYAEEHPGEAIHPAPGDWRETDRSRRAGIPLEAATKDGRRPSPIARHTARQETSFLPPTTAFSGSSPARVTRGKRRTEQRATDSSAKSSGPLQIKLRGRSQRDFQARDGSRREPTARDSTTLETTRRRMRGTPKG